MSERFFNPWIGGNYSDGMGSNGYCVLVLGASLYCDHHNDCPHFNECTNGENKDSSAFNDRCPFSDGTLLEDDLDIESSPTMTRFSNEMEERFGDMLDGDSIWDRIAFAEYVQYFLDHKDTYDEDLSDRDFDAFLETLDELRPDVVIVWGQVVAETLRDSEYTIESDDDDPWDFAWEYDDMFIRFICCTHPASRKWFYRDFPDFAQQFEDTVCGDEDEDGEDDDSDEDNGDEEEDEDDEEDEEDEDDEEGGDEDDEDEDDEDGEDDDSDEDDEEGGDEDDEEEDDEDDDSDEDDEEGGDEDDEDEDDEDDEDDDGDDNGGQPPSDIVLGLVLGNAFERWKRGR